MTFKPLVIALVLWLSMISAGAQQKTNSQSSKADSASSATRKSGANTTEGAVQPAKQLQIETVPVPGEFSHVFLSPGKCDGDGTLYLGAEPDGAPGVRKLSPKGESISTFHPSAADLKILRATYFSLAPDGDIYQLILANEPTPYVLVYKPDGTVKSKIKLDPGFMFSPYKIAVFSSGELFVSGMEQDKDPDNPIMWPYEAIFSSSGAVLKELHFEDDDKIHDMAESGDQRVVLPANRSSNLAIVGGSAETASDGNVYLMRRLDPAPFYAVSPGGAVRRFTVASGKDDYQPSTMHLAGNRIAVLFHSQKTHEDILKVVDLDGKEIATYQSPMANGWSALGLAFICYTSNPDRFTFLTTMKDDSLGIITVTAK